MKHKTIISILSLLTTLVLNDASAADWSVVTQGTLDGGLTYEVTKHKDHMIRLEVKKGDRLLGELNISEDDASASLQPIRLPKGIDEADILLVCTGKEYYTSLRTTKAGEQSSFLCDNDGDGFPELKATKTKMGLMKEAVEYHFIPASNKTDNVEQSVPEYPPQGVGSSEP